MSDEMDARELATLNALVTFAAENVPGGLSREEREVAKKVGQWATDQRIERVEPRTVLDRIHYMGDEG